MKVVKDVGIVSYGVDIPKYRIKIEDIANVWGKDGKSIVKSLGMQEKAVPGMDEDTISLAVNSAVRAMSRIDTEVKIGAVYTGSESHPYAVKSTSVTVGEALGLDSDYTAADLEFACKAGTAGMQMVTGMVASKMIDYGLAIGADTAQSRPNNALEYSAAAAAAAYVIGHDSTQIIANILYTKTYTSDTPDFWRREHESYPSHAGRFTGEPAYFKHLIGSVKAILEESKMKISDFDHVVFHMPNARFPKTAAKILKVTDQQLAAGFTVPYLGNSYSACSMVGLAAALDKSKPGERILVCSYGSGSGSDAFILEVTDNIKKLRSSFQVQELIDSKEYVDYTTYIKNLGKLQI